MRQERKEAAQQAGLLLEYAHERGQGLMQKQRGIPGCLSGAGAGPHTPMARHQPARGPEAWKGPLRAPGQVLVHACMCMWLLLSCPIADDVRSAAFMHQARAGTYDYNCSIYQTLRVSRARNQQKSKKFQQEKTGETSRLQFSVCHLRRPE